MSPVAVLEPTKGRHLRGTYSIPVTGYIPPGYGRRQNKHYGASLFTSNPEATATNIRLAAQWLGVSVGRLAFLLGMPHMNHIYHHLASPSNGHEPPSMVAFYQSRLFFLCIQVKGMWGMDTTKMEKIDWERGLIYFYEGHEPRTRPA